MVSQNICREYLAAFSLSPPYWFAGSAYHCSMPQRDRPPDRLLNRGNRELSAAARSALCHRRECCPDWKPDLQFIITPRRTVALTTRARRELAHDRSSKLSLRFAPGCEISQWTSFDRCRREVHL